jgi:NIMA (never in mitosis gene a)-related kinase
MDKENPRTAATMDSIRALKTLCHRNVIQVLACFGSAYDLHFVTEHLSGSGRLSEMIIHFEKRKRLIPERTIWKYYVQLCRGVDYLHGTGRTHGQLTPQHVLFSSTGVVKLALSCRWFGERESTDGRGKGQQSGYWHMPPEQITDETLTPKSDVWALGCILYEMATLRHPFVNRESGNIYWFVKSIQACRYDVLPPDSFSEGLRGTIAACLHADPGVRSTSSVVLRLAERRFSETSALWTISAHRSLPMAAQECIRTVMLVARRLALEPTSVAPPLPTEMWLAILGRLRTHQMDAWASPSK